MSKFVTLNSLQTFGNEIKSKLYTTQMADFVVEEGTSGIGRYRKGDSGIVECGGCATNQAFNVTSTGGNVYDASYKQGDFPLGLFNKTPVYMGFSFADGSAGALSIELGPDLSKTSTQRMSVSRPGTANITGVTITMYAMGTGK